MIAISLSMTPNTDGSVTIRPTEPGQDVAELVARAMERSNRYGPLVHVLKELVDAWYADDSPEWNARWFKAMDGLKEELKGVQ